MADELQRAVKTLVSWATVVMVVGALWLTAEVAWQVIDLWGLRR